MTVYADGVMLMNFLVDFLLILGTNQLTGYPLKAARASAGAAVGSLYSGACLLPGFRFLGGTLWRIVSLAAMSGIAFGWNPGSIRRGVFLVFLRMALGGMAIGLGNGSAAALALAAIMMSLFCVMGGGKIRPRRFVTMELRYRDTCRKLTALVDTGNLLTDPLTGKSVTVVGANIAREMLGLSKEQLLDPVETIGKTNITGLRLIPYRSVGKPTGMLLAISMDEVRINGEIVGKMVAFSPEIFEEEGFEALTGGAV